MAVQTVEELILLNSQERVVELLEAAESVWYGRPQMVLITVAQAILESGILSKPSRLAVECNNLFGMKAKTGQKASEWNTKEHINGREITVRAGFRLFDSIADCMEAHKQLLMHPRYEDVLNAKTVKEACEQLEECGYATDPNYAEKLMRVINQYLL